MQVESCLACCGAVEARHRFCGASVGEEIRDRGFTGASPPVDKEHALVLGVEQGAELFGCLELLYVSLEECVQALRFASVRLLCCRRSSSLCDRSWVQPKCLKRCKVACAESSKGEGKLGARLRDGVAAVEEIFHQLSLEGLEQGPRLRVLLDQKHKDESQLGARVAEVDELT